MIEIVFKDPSCKNIAVRLSGGPDSAIIYYAVCDYYKNKDDIKIFPYTMSTPLRPHAVQKAQDVINFAKEKTGKSPEQHYVLHHLAHNQNNTRTINNFEYTHGQELLEQQLLDEHQIDIIYYGVSMNCNNMDLQTYVNSLNPIKAMNYHDTIIARDADRDTIFGKRIECVDNRYAFFPFILCDKKTVKHMYDYYGVTKSLFRLTWSCENDFQSHSETPIHCGTCYFCLEREFAFGRL